MRELLYEKIYNDLKNQILDKAYEINDKLPSKRKLASFYNVSVFTVERAYLQLLSEGYIHAVEKKGYFVYPLPIYPLRSLARNIETPSKILDVSYPYDLSTHHVDRDHFPYKTWARISREVLTEASVMSELSESQGLFELREQIAIYLERYRKISVSPRQIIIGSGSQAMIQVIIAIIGRTHQYAMEEPGFKRLRDLFMYSGVAVKSISMDAYGAILDEKSRFDFDVMHITPSHQFPTGIVMAISRRLEWLNWASEKDGRFMIEDDYDSEFRYEGQPIPALQSLDQKESVIYMNTFSKSLSPALKINYLVLPLRLLSAYDELKHAMACSVPLFDQHVLMRFLKEGHFERHLNRMKKIYRKKIDKILEVFKNNPKIHISGYANGLHLVLHMPSITDPIRFQNELKSKGIYLPMINDFVFQKQTIQPIFLMGYAHLSDDKLNTVLEEMVKVLKRSRYQHNL